MAWSYRNREPLRIVNNDELELIRTATFEVLESVGVRFDDTEALGVLADNGCKVQRSSGVVKFPRALVEKCLQAVPGEFRLRARNSRSDLAIGLDAVCFGTCAGMCVLDTKTMKRRPGKLSDVADAARIIAGLDSIGCLDLPGVSHVADKPTETNLEWIYATTLRNCDKVFNIYVIEDSMEWGLRMARAAGTEPMVCVSSTSPLRWNAENIGAVKLVTQQFLPLAVQSVATPGLTGPVTLAGSAVVTNAEILSMVVLIQLLRPGTGVLCSSFNMPFDIRSMTLASGSIEFGMMSALSVQLCRSYGMASMIYAPLSDAKIPDGQAACEKALQWQLFAVAGMNLMMGAGVVENQTAYSHAQLIVDAEVCGMIGRYLDGIRVTTGSLAVDVIGAVGHEHGTYLDHEHTRDCWKDEQHGPHVFSRDGYEAWEAAGAADVLTRANEEAIKVLNSSAPVPLPAEVDRELDALLRAASRQKGV